MGARVALSVRGRAEVEILDGVVEEYLMAARRSMGAEVAAVFEESCRKMTADGADRDRAVLGALFTISAPAGCRGS